MPLFRHAIPRRAFVAAALGALYAMLLLPVAGGVVGVAIAGAWLLLSVSLLFLKPLAYHAYATWAILWIVWRGVAYWSGPPVPLWAVVLNDLLLPAAGLLLLSASGYLQAARVAAEGRVTP